MSMCQSFMHNVSIAKARFYKWLFGTPTTILEAINVAYLTIWACAILNDDLAELPFYAGYLGRRAVHVNDKAALLFGAAAAINIIGMVRQRREADKGAIALQGFALQLSALLWLAVALNFFASYPPLHIGVMTYSTFAFFCWAAGRFKHRYFVVNKQVRVKAIE